MLREIPPDLVKQTRKWLDTKGLEFFRNLKEEYGHVSPCLNACGVPWPVHFREGMNVRNFMRKTGLCDDSWTAHDYDDSWTTLIEECIVE